MRTSIHAIIRIMSRTTTQIRGLHRMRSENPKICGREKAELMGGKREIGDVALFEDVVSSSKPNSTTGPRSRFGLNATLEFELTAKANSRSL